jgi:hypothetical protein
MSEVTGKDIVDFMAEGVSSFVKEHIREQIITEMVDNFRDRITAEVDGKLAEMVFSAYTQDNQAAMQKELIVLIEWSKGQAAYKKKYSQVSEMVE